MLVLSESAWGDPSASPCSATYRTLGFSLDAMETARGGWQEGWRRGGHRLPGTRPKSGKDGGLSY